MLAYPLDEAETLLTGRLSDAKKSMENCEEDLEFLREQITVGCDHQGMESLDMSLISSQTMEVAVARVYNWDVVQKRKEKGEEEAKGNIKSGG